MNRHLIFKTSKVLIAWIVFAIGDIKNKNIDELLKADVVGILMLYGMITSLLLVLSFVTSVPSLCAIMVGFYLMSGTLYVFIKTPLV
ncbi:MAG: hypothetical protein OQJ98_00510 [Candidatus Pacebacteria bacterium]|nr:hypothetical protein [Candidatus Paceibacterota bacterium]